MDSSKPKVEPPARLVEAAKAVIASTTALASSATQTKTKQEKERLRLKEKKKRAKEKKRLEKQQQTKEVPEKQEEEKKVEEKKKKKEEEEEEEPKEKKHNVEQAPPKNKQEKKKEEPKEKKKAVDELTDVIGVPLQPQLAKMLNISMDELSKKTENGLALVRNGTHVLAFARVEQTAGFVIILDAVGEKVHKKKVVDQLVNEAKSAKKSILLSQTLGGELSLGKGSGMFVQL